MNEEFVPVSHITPEQSKHLQGIAILMMLFMHLFQKDYHGLFEPLVFFPNGVPLSFYIGLFCDACVPIFAFVSGYGLYFKFTRDRVGYTKSNRKRLLKLYLTLWIIILLIPVGLGLLMQQESYPGSWTNVLSNLLALDWNSYSGAWWFFTTYVLFVLTSSFWFRLVEKLRWWILLPAMLAVYVAGFGLRIYMPNLFGIPMLDYLQRISANFLCTLPQFLLGTLALKYDWTGWFQKVYRAVTDRQTDRQTDRSFGTTGSQIFCSLEELRL